MVREAPLLTHGVQQTQCSLVIAVRNFQSPTVLCSCELCSHHRRQPDPTKQFCRVGVGGVKWVLLSLGQYYWDVLLTPELMPAIRSIGDVTVFHQDNAPVHRARNTVQRYQTHNFINPGMWAANSCDLNPVDDSIWGLSSSVYVDVPIRTIRTSCCSGLLRHRLIFSRAWWTMRLISGDKDWKRVSMQKVVTANSCCDVTLVRHSRCHTRHITQPGLFRATNVWRETIIPSIRWMSSAFHKVVKVKSTIPHVLLPYIGHEPV